MLVRNTAVLNTSKKKHMPSLKPQEKKMSPWAQRGPVGPYEAQKGPMGTFQVLSITSVSLSFSLEAS